MKAYFQGYGPESDGHLTNPDGTPMFDGHAYYLLEDGTTYADVWWCQENGHQITDNPFPKTDDI